MRLVRTIPTGGRCPSPRRASTRLLAGLLLLAVALAACGKSKTADTNTSNAQDKARQYAQCMRDNGVPDFPDPDANGQIRGQGHEQQNDPKFTAAMEKCRGL